MLATSALIALSCRATREPIEHIPARAVTAELTRGLVQLVATSPELALGDVYWSAFFCRNAAILPSRANRQSHRIAQGDGLVVALRYYHEGLVSARGDDSLVVYDSGGCLKVTIEVPSTLPHANESTRLELGQFAAVCTSGGCAWPELASDAAAVDGYVIIRDEGGVIAMKCELTFEFPAESSKRVFVMSFDGLVREHSLDSLSPWEGGPPVASQSDFAPTESWITHAEVMR